MSSLKIILYQGFQKSSSVSLNVRFPLCFSVRFESAVFSRVQLLLLEDVTRGDCLKVVCQTQYSSMVISEPENTPYLVHDQASLSALTTPLQDNGY